MLGKLSEITAWVERREQSQALLRRRHVRISAVIVTLQDHEALLPPSPGGIKRETPPLDRLPTPMSVDQGQRPPAGRTLKRIRDKRHSGPTILISPTF